MRTYVKQMNWEDTRRKMQGKSAGKGGLVEIHGLLLSDPQHHCTFSLHIICNDFPRKALFYTEVGGSRFLRNINAHFEIIYSPHLY